MSVMALVSPEGMHAVSEPGQSRLMEKHPRVLGGDGRPRGRAWGAQPWDGALRVERGMLLARQETRSLLKADGCSSRASFTPSHGSPTSLPQLTLFLHYSRTELVFSEQIPC